MASSSSCGAKASRLDESKLCDGIRRVDIADAKDGRETLHPASGEKQDSTADSKETCIRGVSSSTPPPATTMGSIASSVDDAPVPTAREVAMGFRLSEMSMRDYNNSGTMLWHSTAFSEEDEASRSGQDLAPCFRADIMSERVPKQILACSAVSREICFSSKHIVQKLSLRQRISLHGQCIEEWKFDFGFVMPGSVNSWQQVIEAAPVMIPAEVLSGNVTFENCFFDGDVFLCRNTVRLFYV